jgi:hypothetical protein
MTKKKQSVVYCFLLYSVSSNCAPFYLYLYRLLWDSISCFVVWLGMFSCSFIGTLSLFTFRE